jgi:hypothetical protein
VSNAGIIAKSQETALASASGPAITIMDAVNDPDIFGPWFRDKRSFAAWFCFLKVIFGLPLDSAELEIFQRLTGRKEPAALGYLVAALVIGRRGGKSLILALIAAYLACFYDWSPYLTGGESGCIMIVAADKKQGRAIFRYLKSMLQIPLLAGRIDRETADSIDLNNNITIEILAANFRTIRSYSICCFLGDEISFWPTDESGANPDSEIINAIRPAMATIPKAMLLMASSPYAKRGVLWDTFRRHFGKDESSTLVWQADTRTMNPSVPQSFIDEAYEDDPVNAAAEYGGTFRTDVTNLVSREAVEGCVVQGRFEVPPMAKFQYAAFCDPSGGSADSMTLAIVHREGEKVVLDAIREARPPFSPEAVVAEFSTLLKNYRLKTVTGDRYAGLWPTERFEVHGIRYEAAAKPKSDLYRDWLPILNGKRCELLDHPKAIAEICGLERRVARGGRDSIDHAPGAHDDLANCIAGAMTGQIIQDWSGGRAWIELARRDMAQMPTVGGHPPGKPEFEKPQWAKGSVEWQREQAGEIVPHPTREKPVSISARRSHADEQISELFDAILKG